MAESANNNYLAALNRRNFLTWCWAAVAALVINAGLFMIMPMLQRHDSAENAPLEVIQHLELVRLKPHETTKERRNIPPPVQKKMEKIPPPPRPLSIKPGPLRLPFKIDAGLHADAESLELLPVESGAMENPNPQGIFSVEDLDIPVNVVVRIPPLYPLRARERGIEGWVKVKLLVDETGRVAQVDIVDAEPAGVFEKSVLRCVRQWKFSKALVAGMPVKIWMETTIRFRLEN